MFKDYYIVQIMSTVKLYMRDTTQIIKNILIFNQYMVYSYLDL